MSTRTVSSKNLVKQDFVQFIRPQIITLTLIEARPSTKMYVFFGDEDVTYLCNLQGSAIGTTLVTDTIGQAVIQLNIPSGKFNVNNYDIVVTDTNSLANLNITGSVFGSARGVFSSTGRIDFFQTTSTSITTVTRSVNVQQDPLAQSFFTYGVDGGIFLSSIEIYFQTKDSTLPVRCELRRLENGFPSPLEANNLQLVSILKPENITISPSASVSSKFVFDPPVYLPEDSDYCFVLRSNSNNYNVFTSRLGEESLEDGRRIFDQPYIGSLFKSENNITWTAEQFEDIKFKINKAVFSTSPGTVEFAAVVPPLGALGTSFSTVNASNIVTYVHNQDHGLEVGSKFKVVTRSDTLYANASFNGIPYAQFNANHTVVSVPNRKTLSFQVTTSATSTGTLQNARIVNHVSVVNEGTGYLPAPTDTITFTGGGSGVSFVNATGTLNVVDGKIKSVTITNSGTNYTSAPTVTINTATGTGAALVASVLPTFTVYVNKPMTGFIPKIGISTFGSSSTTNTVSTTLGNYDGGNLVTYNDGKNITFIENYPYVNIDQNSVIASSYNETSMMPVPGSKSAVVTLELSTDNPNVSPVIDLNTPPKLHAYYHLINTQSGETLTSTNSSGTVSSIIVTNAGSGYTANPVVAVSAPQLSGGVTATATAARTGTAIASITITNAGSGYTNPPTVTITPGAGDTTGVGGAVQAVLNPYNTELLPSGGLAKARYITKKNTIQIISTGVRLFSVLSSNQGSYVDWYIRTSLSGAGIDHETKSWQRLNCSVDRNKSSFIGEFFEYEFTLDDIPEYDTYDLKCVMGAEDPTDSPIIKSYRVIVVA